MHNQDHSCKGTRIIVIAKEYPQWLDKEFVLLWKLRDCNLYSFGISTEDSISIGYLGPSQFKIL